LRAGTRTQAAGLDRAWQDLRFLYVAPAWLFYALMMSAVTVWALALEAHGAPSRWNKVAPPASSAVPRSSPRATADAISFALERKSRSASAARTGAHPRYGFAVAIR